MRGPPQIFWRFSDPFQNNSKKISARIAPDPAALRPKPAPFCASLHHASLTMSQNPFPVRMQTIQGRKEAGFHHKLFTR